MEKGQGKGTDTLQTDKVFTRKEYIEREAAKRAIMSQYISRANKTKYADVIDAVPAADVVTRDCYDRLLAENDELRKERPVVRCKDCKYSAVDFEDRRYCKLVTYYNHVQDDWFCADGERKDCDGDGI